MKKTFKIAALALFAGLTLASCSENDEPIQKVVTVQKEMIVLNQGNYYKGLLERNDHIKRVQGCQ